LRQSYADPEEKYEALFHASNEPKFMKGLPLYIDGVLVFGKKCLGRIITYETANLS
jgi:hypothetical protein